MASLSAFFVCMVSAWFATLVVRKCIQSHRLSELFWGVSLLFSTAASLAYCVAIWSTPHSRVAFILYYALGALWMPAIMGLGSCALVMSKKVVLYFAVVIGLIGLFGSIFLFKAHVSVEALAHLNGGAGIGVIQSSIWLAPLILLNTFGGAAVVIVAAISAVRTLQKRAPMRFFYGNLWLAVGIVIISCAGSAARLGWPQLFWVTMLFGWITTYLGYQLLTPKELAKKNTQLPDRVPL